MTQQWPPSFPDHDMRDDAFLKLSFIKVIIFVLHSSWSKIVYEVLYQLYGALIKANVGFRVELELEIHFVRPVYEESIC